MLGTTKSSEKLFSYYLHCLNIIKLHSRLKYLNKLSRLQTRISSFAKILVNFIHTRSKSINMANSHKSHKSNLMRTVVKTTLAYVSLE